MEDLEGKAQEYRNILLTGKAFKNHRYDSVWRFYSKHVPIVFTGDGVGGFESTYEIEIGGSDIYLIIGSKYYVVNGFAVDEATGKYQLDLEKDGTRYAYVEL